MCRIQIRFWTIKRHSIPCPHRWAMLCVLNQQKTLHTLPSQVSFGASSEPSKDTPYPALTGELWSVFWTIKRHSIPCPHGWAMECLLWGFREILSYYKEVPPLSVLMVRLYVSQQCSQINLGCTLWRRIYTTSEISASASESGLGHNQNKWIDVSCLHWSESMSEIFVSDVCVWAPHYM